MVTTTRTGRQHAEGSHSFALQVPADHARHRHAAYQLQGMCAEGAFVSRLEQLLVKTSPLQVGPSRNRMRMDLQFTNSTGSAASPDVVKGHLEAQP